MRTTIPRERASPQRRVLNLRTVTPAPEQRRAGPGLDFSRVAVLAQRDAGVMPDVENAEGDTGADGGTPGKAPAKAPAATGCNCCVDSVAIGAATKIDNPTHMGHSFDVTIGMTYSAAGSAAAVAPCKLEWWEKTDVPYFAPKQTANTWHDMFALIPTSPTLAPWVNRKQTCGASPGVTITDTPSLGKSKGRTVTRTLEFDIKVFSASGAGCANASKNATAKQVLKMVNAAPDWAGSSFA
jgi:hypothetical protein